MLWKHVQEETNEIQNEQSPDNLTIENIETVKVEKELDDKNDRRLSREAQLPPPLGMRQTRSMRTRMAPKSKTWFPDNKGTAKKNNINVSNDSSKDSLWILTLVKMLRTDQMCSQLKL